MSPFSRAAAERNKRLMNRILAPMARVGPGLALLIYTASRPIR